VAPSEELIDIAFCAKAFETYEIFKNAEGLRAHVYYNESLVISMPKNLPILTVRNIIGKICING